MVTCQYVNNVLGIPSLFGVYPHYDRDCCLPIVCIVICQHFTRRFSGTWFIAICVGTVPNIAPGFSGIHLHASNLSDDRFAYYLCPAKDSPSMREVPGRLETSPWDICAYSLFDCQCTAEMHGAMPCDEGYKKLCCLLSAKRIHQSGLSIDSENLISEDRVIDELVSDDLGAS